MLELAFNFETAHVRTITDGEEIWFVGKDVAEALGYSNVPDALARHVETEDKIVFEKSRFTTFDAPNRGLTVINESGVYALILGSNLPSAVQFKHWVTHDVLPSIRKQGFYSLLPDEELLNLLSDRMKKNPRLIRDSTFDEKSRREIEKFSVEKAPSNLRLRRKELTKKEYMNELGALNLSLSRYNAEYRDAERFYEKQELRAARERFGFR